MHPFETSRIMLGSRRCGRLRRDVGEVCPRFEWNKFPSRLVVPPVVPSPAMLPITYFCRFGSFVFIRKVRSYVKEGMGR